MADTYRKKKLPAAVRRAVLQRYGASYGTSWLPTQCHYCPSVGFIDWTLSRSWPSVCDLEFDHVTPEFRGGTPTAENIVLACRRCNRSKGFRASAPTRTGVTL